ncbi:MAG: glycosyltransferase [Coriobacteriia bacterium]|nr:glycosyltransferase [Coriobacteriia bacterium]
MSEQADARDYSKHSAAVILRGRRVALIRSAPVAHDKRTQQIGRLLSKAGARVTIVVVGAANQVNSGQDFELIQVPVLPASTHPVWAFRVVSNVIRNRIRRHALRRSIVRIQTTMQAGADILHCMNLDTLLTGMLAARGRPVIYDSREHFATTGDVPRLTRLRWKFVERVLIRRAAAVITVSEPIADDLASRYSIAKPTVIYNGCTECVNQASPVHNPLRLLHLGKYFYDRNLDELVRAVAALSGRVELTLQGWGDAEHALRGQVADLGAGHLVRFVPPCAPEDVARSAQDQDVGVINFKSQNDSFRWSAPNKLFDYMGSGLCVLAPDLPVMKGIVESSDCGMVFPSGSEQGLLEAISYLASHPEEVARFKHNAVVAAQRYSWDSQAETLYAAYAAALSRGKPSASRGRVSSDLERSGRS